MQSANDEQQAELLGGLYEEDGRFGWWISLKIINGSGEELREFSKRLFKTTTAAEKALDREIERISVRFAKDGAHILAKDGKFYA